MISNKEPKHASKKSSLIQPDERVKRKARVWHRASSVCAERRDVRQPSGASSQSWHNTQQRSDKQRAVKTCQPPGYYNLPGDLRLKCGALLESLHTAAPIPAKAHTLASPLSTLPKPAR